MCDSGQCCICTEVPQERNLWTVEKRHRRNTADIVQAKECGNIGGGGVCRPHTYQEKKAAEDKRNDVPRIPALEDFLAQWKEKATAYYGREVITLATFVREADEKGSLFAPNTNPRNSATGNRSLRMKRQLAWITSPTIRPSKCASPKTPAV